MMSNQGKVMNALGFSSCLSPNIPHHPPIKKSTAVNNFAYHQLPHHLLRNDNEQTKVQMEKR
jgi:hypothetical protein